MIKSFRSRQTRQVFSRERVKQFEAIRQSAQRKLNMLHAATRLDDLAAVPGNRLETLHHDREGQHRIRINNQWRVCFVWRDGDAYDVEITDYQ